MTALSRLFLPAHALLSRPVSDIAPGRLVLRMAHGGEKSAKLGIRFDFDDGRFVLPVLGQENLDGHRAVEVTGNDERAYQVGLEFSLEADLEAPVRGWGVRDARAGELACGASGCALIVGLHPLGRYPFNTPIRLSDWTKGMESELDTVFGGWRVRITIPQSEPVYINPVRAAGPGAAA
ncbi:hypothetical protein [Phenylobacterium kunshanense]|uniref:Uncharacterized protein n=1 Tax=Phenylobacterium kunshanense TaxID=1445034 RepID=A0A328BKA6_9CAUL|nr:hypothetical protein [Phenylobacterium kunshanense]RAK66364.1 hypothetical protein DJ019_08950 [Phenylobacterium kunshanense]